MRKKTAQEKHTVFLSEDEIFVDHTIDAIVICTSSDTHAHFIEKALQYNKHVFCEKPLETNYEKASILYKKTRETDRICMLGFNRRFDENFYQLYQNLEQGKIGSLESVSITSRDPAPPPLDYLKQSGSLFRDMMIHDFDMARWLLGEEPQTIYATGSCLVDKKIAEIGDIDTASVIIKTKSGQICQIANSRRACYGYDQRIEIFGSEGMLIAGNVLNSTVQHYSKNGINEANPKYFFLERYAKAYELEMDNFIESLINQTKPRVDIYDGVMSLKVADAACLSHQENRLVNLNEV